MQHRNFYQMNLNYISLLFVLLISACQSSESNRKNEHEKVQLPNRLVGKFDTASIISALGIKERASRLDLLSENIIPANKKLDTLELTYYFSFCDCQEWIPATIHKKMLAQHKDLDKLDPRGQIKFNLDEDGYYIEEADSSLEIDYRTGVNGTTIRFIGKEYMGKRLPKNKGFTVPNPPVGRVFRYYSYEIIRPYFIWGPEVFTEIDPETGDSLTEPSILTVK